MIAMKKKPTNRQWPRPPGRRVPAKWNWHFDALLAERERLLADRSSLLRAAAAPLEPHSMDEADSATDEFDHDLALGELSAGCAVIREVDDAIHRALSGTYGICEATGRPIPAARLRAIPWTRYCAEAEERLERGGGGVRPHLAGLRSLRGGTGLGDGEPGEEMSSVEEEAVRVKPGAVVRGRVRRGVVKTRR
jgi:RNA polymerase-binding transcription factor DksA